VHKCTVGIATHYGLDSLGIESRWGGEVSRSRPDRSWGPPSLLHNGYRVSLPGVNRPGYGVNHPPQSNTEVKERVELHLYSPSGPSWPVLGRTLPCFNMYYLADCSSVYRYTPCNSFVLTKRKMFYGIYGFIPSEAWAWLRNVYRRSHCGEKRRLPSSCPSVSVSADPARRTLVKFDIGDMKTTYPTKSAYNRTKTPDTSHAGLRAFYCHRRQNFDIKAFLCSTQYF
jgi:hypothetical protein